MEVETYLVIVHKLRYIPKEELQGTWGLAQEVGKMLTAMMMKLHETSTNPKL